MTETEWVASQTNRALQSMYEVDYARVRTLEAGLPFHGERTKNWDNYLAVWHARHFTAFDTPILDAGACRDKNSPSAFLPGMARKGYRHLHGVNLDETNAVFEGGVCYSKGDITGLDFHPGMFGFVACLSTIEHGVDIEKFFTEMARIIYRKGRLFISFDFWETPIDVGGRTAFGVPVKIFNTADVLQMIRFAESQGFYCDLADLSCKDKVVQWLGLEYTFANLLFERR